ncbi:MAG: ArsI/CadI family heavy metal resistance metalloenzyme [Pseudomonadota bacterium]
MKRMHIHVGVEDLEKSIGFYSALFRAAPAKTKTDYAKWMLDDPRINFAISTRADNVGVNHLGLQVDQAEELETLRGALEQADVSMFDEGEAVCCYARSDKTWVRDPSGVAWETYHTMEDAALFGAITDGPESPDASDESIEQDAEKTASACCA